jgi:hypothetical protein
MRRLGKAKPKRSLVLKRQFERHVSDQEQWNPQAQRKDVTWLEYYYYYFFFWQSYNKIGGEGQEEELIERRQRFA